MNIMQGVERTRVNWFSLWYWDVGTPPPTLKKSPRCCTRQGNNLESLRLKIFLEYRSSISGAVDKKSHTSHKDFQTPIRLPRAICSHLQSPRPSRCSQSLKVTRTRITHLTKTSLIKLYHAHLSLQSLSWPSSNKMTRYLNGCPWGACIATNSIEECWYPLQKYRQIYQKTSSDRPANTTRSSGPSNHTKLFNVLVETSTY